VATEGANAYSLAVPVSAFGSSEGNPKKTMSVSLFQWEKVVTSSSPVGGE